MAVAAAALMSAAAAASEREGQGDASMLLSSCRMLSTVARVGDMRGLCCCDRSDCDCNQTET